MSGGFRGAVGFLTAAGGATAPTPGALAWFPVVGAGAGAVVGAVWWLAGDAWPAAVAAALTVIADLAITGLLHIDGLCDAADGLIAPMSVDRRLQVMAAPDVGAFGVATCGATLLLRWAAFVALRPSVLLVAALWALSRTGMAVVTARMTYARPGGGLATAFRTGPRSRLLAPALGAGAVGSVVLAAGWRVAVGPIAVLAAAAGMAGVVVLAWRRLGGFTGDVLGAAAVVGETVGLVVAAARW